MTPQELFELALTYYNGTEDIPQDYLKAYDLFLEAAKAGHVGAQSYLGRMLCMGEGIAQNYDEAIKWLLPASEAGDPDAQNRLGVRYRCGQGVVQDYLEAARLFKLSAEQGNPKALFNLATLHQEGQGVEQDKSKAYALIMQAAEDGDVLAQSYLGRMLCMGEHTEKNYAEAIKWLKLAAEAGCAESQNRLGVRYYYGEGVPLDYKEAFRWFLKSASQGYAKSYGNVANSYLRGNGVSRNYSEALKYYEMAISAGTAQAAIYYNVGVFYKKGFGSAPNYTKALENYQKAAELGYAQAYHSIGHLYEEGAGLPADPQKALEYFLIGAEKGDAEAQKHVAEYYHDGICSEVDYLKALSWLKRAHVTEESALPPLALMFNGRNGIEVNNAETIRLLNKCSTVLAAQLDLASMFLLGIGVERNPERAVKIWKKISRLGYRLVNINLGIAYYTGVGVNKDKKLAINYLNTIKSESNYAGLILQKISEDDILFQPTFVTKYDEGILKDSLLEAEYYELQSDKTKATKIYKKYETGESYYNLARLGVNVNLGYTYEEVQDFFQLSIDKKYPKALYLAKVFDGWRDIQDINFNAPFYLVDILSNLFNDESIDQINAACFIVYCVLNSISLESIRSANIPDAILETCPSRISDKFIKLYEYCSYRDKRELEAEFIEYLIDTYEEGRYNSIFCPSDTVLDKIKETIYSCNPQTVFFSKGNPLKIALETDIFSYVQCQTQREYYLASYIIEICKKSNIKLIYGERHKINAEMYIGFPSMRSDASCNFDSESNISATIEEILTPKNTYKSALILVDKEFCSSFRTDMYDQRCKLIEDKAIVKIKEFPVGSFADLSSEASLLQLNFSNDNQKEFIEFDRNNNVINVSYTDISNKNYVLNSLLYSHSIENSENKKLIKLNELVSICNFGKANYSHRVVNKSHYSNSLLQALSTKTIIVEDADKRSPLLPRYTGKSIVLSYSDKLYIYIHKSDEQFIVEDNKAIVLNVKTDIIDTDYLAYLFLSDDRLGEYIRQIASTEGYIMPQDLLQFDILIDEDIPVQNQIVEQALIKERQLSSSGLDYNVILLSEQPELIEDQFNQKGIDIFKRLSSVNEEECTFEDLYEQYIEDSSKTLVDAIIIDSLLEDYEDVLYFFRTIRERNIQIYLLGNKDEIRLAGSKLKEYFLKGDRVFNQASDGYLDRLLNKMRDDLDSSNAPQAKIRNKYKTVFEAADALDKKYPDIGVSKTVLRYIQTGCNIDDVDNVSGPCGSFRNVCHKLLQVFVSKKLVPDIDPGAIPAMLRDGRFYDGKTQRTYILKEQFMSKYLSRALEYFCKVTNEGVHGSQDSSRLGTAALNILMEFIVWFYENDICSNKLDEIPVNPCYEDITDKLPSLKGKVYTVKAQGAGKDRYLYADNIHIKENKILKPGMKIKIKDVGAEMIAEDDRRKIDDEYMVFYTSNYDIL